jgi:hypothetical protein
MSILGLHNGAIETPRRYAGGIVPRILAVISGDAGGTVGAGRRGAWRTAYATAGCLFGLACIVNVLSRLYEAHGSPVWRQAVGEVTSIASIMACIWIVFAAVDRAGAGWPRALRVHAPACCLFSALHCVGMWTLRRLICTALGVPYGWSVPAGQVFYEFRKDVVTYVVVALIYRGVERMRQDAAAAPVRDVPAASYDIRDGARLHRVPVRHILAVSSAGNYVEFVLADGKKRLMRGTLAGVLSELAPSGFLRIHRSWLVNQHAVRALEPDRSGDYTLTLDDGSQAPMSRRFPEALAALRNPDLK